jgi:hypothetical protein
MVPTGKSISLVRSLLCSVVLCAAGSLFFVPFVSSCTPQATVGNPPAADADMKTVIINVFGMT